MHEPGLLPILVILVLLQSCLLLLMIVDEDSLEIVRAGEEQLQVVDDVELQEGGRGLMRPEHVTSTHEGLEGQRYSIILVLLLLVDIHLRVSLEFGLLKKIVHEHLYQVCALRHLLQLNCLLLFRRLLLSPTASWLLGLLL